MRLTDNGAFLCDSATMSRTARLALTVTRFWWLARRVTLSVLGRLARERVSTEADMHTFTALSKDGECQLLGSIEVPTGTSFGTGLFLHIGAVRGFGGASHPTRSPSSVPREEAAESSDWHGGREPLTCVDYRRGGYGGVRRPDELELP